MCPYAGGCLLRKADFTLKSNILIGNDRHARLAGFSLITLFPDQSVPLSSYAAGGSTRWMSPELLDPPSPSRGHPTRQSDCYALGMVIYEVLSGQAPFSQDTDHVVMRKVLEGGHPDRPQGAQGKLFPDGIWEMLEGCWERQPSNRPTLAAILRCLQDPVRRRGSHSRRKSGR